MSRTNRNVEHIHSGALRHPHTFNEIRQLDGILQEEDLEEYPLSGFNHMHSRENTLPTSWEDAVVSAWYETDYQK
jgi:hypothetical protein